MKFQLIFIFTLVSNKFFAVSAGTWPQPLSLVAFWPFDSEYQLKDAAHDITTHSVSYAKLMTNFIGPYGEYGTCYSVTKDNTSIASYKSIQLPSKFTISFYFYTFQLYRGSIFMFWGDNCGSLCPRLSINYKPPNHIEFFGGPNSGQSIGSFGAIIYPNTWNFVAITYDGSMLRIYNEEGDQKGGTNPPILSDSSTYVNVGFSNWGSGTAAMKTGDAIACLMIYNTTLTTSEIKELPYQCRTKGKGTTTTAPATTTPTVPTGTPWPRPNALVGFWPLDSQYLFRDVSVNAFDSPASSNVELANGPFGDPQTSMTATSDSTSIMTLANEKAAVSKSFTISLFFKRAGTSGGIFEFQDKLGTLNAFQFRYVNETTVEVSANSLTIGYYTIIQQKGAWTFMAFVFNASAAQLSVYSRHGLVSPPTLQAFVLASNSFNNKGITLGYSSRWSQGLSKGDSISCLMIYNEALTGSEIHQAFEACRIVHGSVPCGSPKLPIEPIPQATMITTIPKAGQFPFIAALRTNSITCSASIIDEFWLVTASACVPSGVSIADYWIDVGEHDVNAVEGHTKRHLVSQIIRQNKGEARDIALVQVTEPIDFKNQYVNDACLFRNDMVNQLKFDTTQFVFGWGKNGRQPLISQTLPRYVPGLMMSDSQCTQAWGSDYVPMKDFCFLSSSNDRNVPCTGDEGTGLLVQAPGNSILGTSDHLVQVGVYYNRDSGCTLTKPGLFANIAESADWIAEKLACTVPGVVYPEKCSQN